jgi:hypothetical protein
MSRLDWYRVSKSDLASKILSLRPALAEAAQKEYDAWEHDEIGIDDELESSGIGHNIADAMADVLMKHGINVHVMDNNMSDRHVWVVAYNDGEAFHVDIPSETYESGWGHRWDKIPEVIFDETDVSVFSADKATLRFVVGNA